MDGEEVEAWARASGGCSHTHSCNPPGPEDASHSHTCFHTHTHLIIPDSQENGHSDSSNKRRSCGNREAVRKYREKKKARTAYLEDEVQRLQSMNEFLLRKLQKAMQRFWFCVQRRWMQRSNKEYDLRSGKSRVRGGQNTS
ncbi:hypothetical protein Bca52824_046757 [Brassica carinata]|uniref:BZIP domain-containing protein n=1 Tax=Brassica carinata TaxID=52824 RepID=A0A8X7RDD7_BRACI|nr:hypothetical protein Bca52824_046757 [Brassica carinata]